MPPLIGDEFNRWTVIGDSYTLPDKRGHFRRWVPCRCKCGTERDILAFQLNNGHSKSCGCWKEDYVDGELLSFKGFGEAHGLSSKHPLYKTWLNMRRRCYDVGAHNYKHYGGRGIQVCEEWREDALAFVTWLEANLGPRPKGHTLDRLDNNGNYEPGNVRWATQAEQNANKHAPNGRRVSE
jgi:hypothetical protein